MIEKLLEAYEAKTAGKRTFMEKLAKMDRLTKILFWGIIVSAIIVLGLSLFLQSQAMFIVMIIYVIIIYVLTSTLERTRHRKWKSNLKEYNEDLDLLTEILNEEDFNLYEKNKIKQLICKYYRSIEQGEVKNAKKSSDLKEFICTYIVPVIAFFAGKINITDSSNT